jgi:hypothetical protein
VPEEPRRDLHPAIEYVERAAVRRREAAGAEIRAAIAQARIRDPEGWRNGDSLDEMRTRFRRLWHALVLHGAARDSIER